MENLVSVSFIFLQTAAGQLYCDMLKCTSIPNRIFCSLQGGEYRDYIGVKQGYYDWQATYNRIPMLMELINEGFTGWVIYADADAYVRDVNFDFGSYIRELPEKTILVAASGANKAPWDVNAGVFLLNLGDNLGIKLVQDWWRLLGRHAPERYLRSVVEPWGRLPSGDQILNDQTLLHLALQNDRELLSRTWVETASLLNYSHASFIRQEIRGHHLSEHARLAALRSGCAAALKAVKFPINLNLKSFAGSFQTDKGTAECNGRSYVRFYRFLLEQFRLNSFSALEVGLLRGSQEADTKFGRHPNSMPSIFMWLEYFPFIKLYGIDVNDLRHLQSSRFQFYQLDLSDLAFALELRRRLPDFRFVIDDGSHASFHQQVAFAAFFPKVAPGGYYIVEDCHRQPAHVEKQGARPVREIFQDFSSFRNLDLHTSIMDKVSVYELSRTISDVFVHREAISATDKDVIDMIVIRKRD